MEYDQVIKYVEELEELIETGGWPNVESSNRVKKILFALSTSELFNGYIREKLSSIENYSDILFSTRKFENYGGHDKVAHILRMDCSNLRSAIKQYFQT